MLLWQRALNPQKGTWSLPGGTLRDDEDLTTSARRLLAEKVDLRKVAHLEQLSVFSDPQRVPGPRRIASTFLGLVPLSADPQLPPDTAWHPVSKLPEMSFDHGTVVRHARNRLAAKLSYTNIAFGLAPEEFAMSTLREIYCAAPRLPGRCHQLATRAGASRRSDSHRQHRTVRQVGWTSTRPVPFHRLHLAGHRRIRRTTAAKLTPIALSGNSFETSALQPHRGHGAGRIDDPVDYTEPSRHPIENPIGLPTIRRIGDNRKEAMGRFSRHDANQFGDRPRRDCHAPTSVEKLGGRARTVLESDVRDKYNSPVGGDL